MFIPHPSKQVTSHDLPSCKQKKKNLEYVLDQVQVEGYVLPIVQVSVSLCQLRTKIDSVACEEKVVLGCDGHRVAHESGRVDDQGASHGSGDTTSIITHG
jgi:hypothetical protein